jgi:hypothetical protein
MIELIQLIFIILLFIHIGWIIKHKKPKFDRLRSGEWVVWYNDEYGRRTFKKLFRKDVY